MTSLSTSLRAISCRRIAPTRRTWASHSAKLSASSSTASSARAAAAAARRCHSTLTEPADLSSAPSIASRAELNAAAFDSHYSYVHDASTLRSLRSDREPVRPHAVSPQRTVPRHNPVPRPPYASTGVVLPSLHPERILLHSSSSAERMAAAARLARRTLDFTCSLAEPGVTTDEIDRQVHQRILRKGAYPSPLNYAGFPKSVCSSVNEVICHGIPDARELEEGDVVSFDVSCFFGGVHGDNCATVIVGDCEEAKDNGNKSGSDGGDAAETGKGTDAVTQSDGINQEGLEFDWRGLRQKSLASFSDREALSRISSRRLVRAARESLVAGVEACRPGTCLTEIGAAIHAVSDAYGYGTVRKYRGHGISEDFHTSPFVKHYRNSDRAELRPGMIFTIEPMITEGTYECEEWDDDWTVVTLDGGMAAQFEHTVLITEDGVRILTLP